MALQIDWFRTLEVFFFYTGPAFMTISIIAIVNWFGYMFLKFIRGTKGIRVFYFGPNGELKTSFVKVGTENHDQEVTYNDRSYVFDRTSLFTLPYDFPKYGNEKCIFISYDNSNPLNPFDRKNKVSSKMFNTIINSKLAQDFAQDKTSFFDKIKMEHVMLLGVIAVGIYLISSRFMGA